MKRILDNAFSIIQAKDGESYLFVDRILKPMIRRVFECADTSLPPKEEIDEFIIELFANWEVEIRVPGFCHQNAISQQTEIGGKSVLQFIAEWFLRADLSYGAEIDILPENIHNCLESSLHEVLGSIKLAHEICHSFTVKILAHTIRKRTHPLCLQTTHTPTKLGTKPVSSNAVVGDMGYVFEELLFGGEFHFFMDYQKTPHFQRQQQKFTAKGLTEINILSIFEQLFVISLLEATTVLSFTMHLGLT